MIITRKHIISSDPIFCKNCLYLYDESRYDEWYCNLFRKSINTKGSLIPMPAKCGQCLSASKKENSKGGRR